MGGGGRGVGKTALVCGVLAALPERSWVAVKITSHAHGAAHLVWEESEPGECSDTARYLAAGARRAFLLTAADEVEMRAALNALWKRVERSSDLIIESNRVLSFLKPDLCLIALSGADGANAKASFESALDLADAVIVSGAVNDFRDGLRPEFELARFKRISPALKDWIRGRLG